MLTREVTPLRKIRESIPAQAALSCHILNLFLPLALFLALD
jgi:hypothetical protein